MPEWSRFRGFALVAFLVLVGDQVSKWKALEHLTDTFEPSASEGPLVFSEKMSRFVSTRHPDSRRAVEVVRDVWEYRYVENPGAAWGFLSQTKSRLRTPFFIVVTVAAMIFILTYFYSTSRHQTLLRTALALVFGGAIGNFVDRVRLGYVIDFIHWHWRDAFSWPTFNIADSAITVGVVFMALDLFLSRPDPARR